VRHLTGARPTGLEGQERSETLLWGKEHQSCMWSGDAPVGETSGLSGTLGPRQVPGSVN